MVKCTPPKVIACLLLILQCLAARHGFPQKEANNWYFGNQAGIDFNTGYPVVLNNSSMLTYDGSTVMSDSAGNLLFYSNGEKIWNRNHVIMPNGLNLNGSSWNNQSCLAILKPGSDHLYYLFTVSNVYTPIPLGGFYSLIDMNLDGGLGDIVPGQKNILIPNTDSVANHIAAIRHANNKDYWIFFRNYKA
jgi:hypothetical protein